ncbi:uncharacterized protein [Mobula birostris]|uniref:uncharacterized protein isoform X4 n=1 Tax=Mobula birostris TaxID=1983395 RepID=UPI003B28A562
MSEVTINPMQTVRRSSAQTDSGVISDSSDKFDPCLMCPEELEKGRTGRGSEVEQAHNSSTSCSGDNCDQQETETESAKKKSNKTGLGSLPTQRLLIICNKVNCCSDITGASWPHVTVVNYVYESSTLDSISAQVAEALNGKQVKSVAFILYIQQEAIYICGSGEVQTLTPITIRENKAVQRFFDNIVSSHIDVEDAESRMDFLGCTSLLTTDLEELRRDLEILTGAYGTAVLYRKKDDDSLVILKEINMHELNHIERQRALNEVKVLSMLDHPNIINYYDSFEEDGVLMIEMEYAEGGTLAQYLAQQMLPDLHSSSSSWCVLFKTSCISESLVSKTFTFTDRELEELEILNLFHQMVAATCYLHEHNVLHRDLKTANLFLTKEGEVKLGDFGVAKLMMTGSEAHTILGTPYYISPEICEGKCYNDKSDIWSLGCILYEMACRQRTFEGTNLPAVVNKIMKGQFAPITNNYSAEFKGLVMDMLQKEPQYRPSAHELLYVRLPEMMAKYEETPVQEKGPGSGLRCGLSHKKNGRTALYYFSMSDMELCPLDGLPAKIKIRQVTVSDNHMIAVTVERAVYTWGSNLKGQLGHGDLQSRSRPQLVEALKGKFIARASCGRGFSVFISDNGIVMTSGDGAQGCLGHGDFFSTSRPCLIEALLGVNVQAIACGQQHVVCVSGDGEVFSWGNGKFGKLGLGNDDNSCLPMKVTFEEQIFIKDVKCGLDGTMFLTDTGSLLACGNNQYNKLGLNERRGLLMQMTMLFARTDVEGRKVPTVVKALRNQHVSDAVLGPSHTIVLVEPGNVFTFGRNTEGQLGTGNTKPYKMPVHVKQLQHQTISIISCGETFSVAGTDNNIILFWGTWSKLTLSPNPSASVRACQAGTSATSESPSPVETQDSNSGTASHKDGGKNSDDEKQLSGIESKSADEDKLDAPESSLSQKNTNWSKAGSLEQHESYTSMTSVKGKRKSKKDHTETSPESIKSECKDLQEPASSKPNTFGSESSLQEGESSQLVPVPVVSLKQNLEDCVDVCSPCLRGIMCNREIIYVLVEGTDPPCHRPARRFRSFRKRGNRESTVLKQGHVLHYSHSSNEAGDEYTSSEMSELETSNFVPTWIRNELNEAMVTGARGDEKHREVDTVTSSTKSGVDDLSPAGEINREGAKPLAEQVAGGLEMTSGNYDGAKHSSISTSGSSDGQPIPFKQKTARSKDKHGKPVQGFPVSTSQRRHYQTKMDMGPDLARICSKPVKACDRNISATPWKSGMPNTPGPGNQKSLNRLRISRGRGKSRAVWLNSETSALKNSKYYHHPAHITSPLSKNKCGTFPGEVRRKQTAEERIQSQEEEHNNLYLLEEQQRLALEREARLQTEIDKLYKELKEQKQLLKENHDVMQQLQEHLLKVQSQRFRSNVQAEPGHAVKAVTKPESKICTVM